VYTWGSNIVGELGRKGKEDEPGRVDLGGGLNFSFASNEFKVWLQLQWNAVQMQLLHLLK
jgi:alpha-tubulin suppressor-like RCC1 family protein